MALIPLRSRLGEIVDVMGMTNRDQALTRKKDKGGEEYIFEIGNTDEIRKRNENSLISQEGRSSTDGTCPAMLRCSQVPSAVAPVMPHVNVCTCCSQELK